MRVFHRTSTFKTPPSPSSSLIFLFYFFLSTHHHLTRNILSVSFKQDYKLSEDRGHCSLLYTQHWEEWLAKIMCSVNICRMSGLLKERNRSYRNFSLWFILKVFKQVLIRCFQIYIFALIFTENFFHTSINFVQSPRNKSNILIFLSRPWMSQFTFFFYWCKNFSVINMN